MVRSICCGGGSGGQKVRRSMNKHKDLGHMPGHDCGAADGDAGPDFCEGGTVGMGGEDGGWHECFGKAVEPVFHFVGQAGPFCGEDLLVVNVLGGFVKAEEVHLGFC